MITETCWALLPLVFITNVCDIYMFKEFVSARIGTGQAPRVPDIVIIKL